MIALLHIPRTAGQSYLALLQRRFGKRRVLRDINDPAAMAAFLARPDRDRIAVLHGHMPWGIHRALGHRVRYIAMLREPVDRALSDYAYAAWEIAHPLHAEVASGAMSLATFARINANGQVRRLQRVPLDGPWFPDTDTLDAAALSAAKALLRDEIGTAGIYERPEATLALFCAATGCTTWRLPRRNAVPGRRRVADLTAAEHAALRDANRLDLDLYEWALGLEKTSLPRVGLSP